MRFCYAVDLKKIAIFATKTGEASEELWHARLDILIKDTKVSV